jgi:hypothetical protein
VEREQEETTEGGKAERILKYSPPIADRFPAWICPDSLAIFAYNKVENEIDGGVVMLEPVRSPSGKIVDLSNWEIKTPEAEKEYREHLTRKLQDFNSRWEQIATDRNAKQESEALRQILDSERPRGQKLYSAE